MVNCSYCGKELKRLVFCSGSHKVMYHAKGKKETKLIESPSYIPNTNRERLLHIIETKGCPSCAEDMYGNICQHCGYKIPRA